MQLVQRNVEFVEGSANHGQQQLGSGDAEEFGQTAAQAVITQIFDFVLKQIEEAVCTPLKGFGDLSIDELMCATGLTREAAIRAKLREYDEPYLVAGPPSIAEEVGR